MFQLHEAAAHLPRQQRLGKVACRVERHRAGAVDQRAEAAAVVVIVHELDAVLVEQRQPAVDVVGLAGLRGAVALDHLGADAGAGLHRDRVDIDVVDVGTLSPHFEAEMPLVLAGVFSRFPVGDFVIQVNNRKIAQGFYLAIGLTDVLLTMNDFDGARPYAATSRPMRP